ncbi:MAG: pyridoxal phosphate-dependent aminotransferase [Chloroflexota bacterium]
MAVEPKPEVRRAPYCPHGSLSNAEREAKGLVAVLDFSANGNPLGPIPSVRRALAGCDPYRYPDDRCTALRGILAAQLGLNVENLVVGNGSVEIIWGLAAAYLRAGDRVLVVGPTFGEYARAAALAGARVETWLAQPESFAPNAAAIAAAIARSRPRLVFLCNPNNPTGAYLSAEAVQEVLRACSQSLLVLDEAYLPFVANPDSLIDLLGDDLLLLRSLTKDFGLAGLRLGYAVSSPAVVDALWRVKPPWSVNAAALAAGEAALADGEHVLRGRAVARQASDYLGSALSALGLAVVPSRANFMLVRVGDAATTREGLLRRGCCVRDCTSFGLPEYVRVGLRPLDDCRRLVAAWEEYLATR